MPISSIISNSFNKYWQTFFWGEFEQIAALILPNLETIMISMTIPSCYNDNDNIDDDNNWVSVVSSVDSSISVKLKPRAIFKNYILLLARSLGKKMAKYNGSKFWTPKLTFRKKKAPFYYVYQFSKKNAAHSYIHINRLDLFIFFSWNICKF